jgi:REP element-mobilizing transposase RayT
LHEATIVGTNLNYIISIITSIATNYIRVAIIGTNINTSSNNAHLSIEAPKNNNKFCIQQRIKTLVQSKV